MLENSWSEKIYGSLFLEIIISLDLYLRNYDQFLINNLSYVMYIAFHVHFYKKLNEINEAELRCMILNVHLYVC